LEPEEVTARKARGRDVRRPPRGPLSPEERAAVRRAGAEDARRSRLRQGLPERIEDAAAIAVLAALLRTARSTRNLESPGDDSTSAA
jgi:hypothetical protein